METNFKDPIELKLHLLEIGYNGIRSIDRITKL